MNIGSLLSERPYSELIQSSLAKLSKNEQSVTLLLEKVIRKNDQKGISYTLPYVSKSNSISIGDRLRLRNYIGRDIYGGLTSLNKTDKEIIKLISHIAAKIIDEKLDSVRFCIG